jgi:predicted nucleic acid-binding protein
MARSRRSRGHGRVREAPAAGYAAEPLTGVLLDSDVVIEILRGRREVALAMARLEASGVATHCTAVNWAEVFAGVRAGEEAAAQAFFDARREVALDAAIGRRAGGYLARYGRSHGVGIADALIAAAAAMAHLRLWTRSRRHYPMPDVVFL